MERSIGGLAVNTTDSIRNTTQELEKTLGGLTLSTTDSIRTTTQDLEKPLGGLTNSTVDALKTTTMGIERLLGGMQLIAAQYGQLVGTRKPRREHVCQTLSQPVEFCTLGLIFKEHHRNRFSALDDRKRAVRRL